MTIHTTIESPASARAEVHRRHVERVAQYAHKVGRMGDAYWSLRFLEALSFCIDTDLSAEMDDLRHDLRIDREGYTLNDDGDRIAGADRRYVPLQSLAVRAIGAGRKAA